MKAQYHTSLINYIHNNTASIQIHNTASKYSSLYNICDFEISNNNQLECGKDNYRLRIQQMVIGCLNY